MKKLYGIIIHGIFICAALCSCNSRKQLEGNWSVSAPTPLPKMIWEASFDWGILRDISPDGKWFAEVITTDDSMIVKAINTENPNMSLDSDPISLTSGIIGMRISSWSPDSSSIVVVYSTKVQAPCYDRGIFIFHLDEAGGRLDKNRFEPSELDPWCAYTVWSPDGKQIAVNFNPSGFYIVSAQGELLHTIMPDLNKGSSLYFEVWTDFGLIYNVYDPSDDRSVEFRLVDPANPETYETLLTTTVTTQSLIIIDTDSASQKILLNEGAKYFLLDVPSKTLSLVGEMYGEDKRFAGPRGEKPFTPMILGQKASKEIWLWVFNWETREFTKLLQINTLLGWVNDYGGYAVIIGDEIDGYEIRIVRP